MSQARTSESQSSSHPREHGIFLVVARWWRAALLGNATVVTVAGAMSLVATALAGLYLARQLGPDRYGQLSSLLNEVVVLSLVSGFGLTVGATAAAAAPTGSAGQQEWSQLLSLRILTLVVPLMIGLGWSVVAGEWVHAAIGLLAAAVMLQDFLGASLQGLGRFRMAAATLAGQPLLFLALTWLAVRGDGGDIGRVLLAYGASFLVWVLVGLQAIRSGRLARLGVAGLTAREAGRMMTRNAQFQVMAFVQLGFASVPFVILGNYGHYTEAALLSVVLTLTRLIPSLAGPAIGGYYYASLCRLLARGEELQAHALCRTFGRTMTLAGTAAFIGLWIFPEVAIRVLYADQYLPAASTLALLSSLSLAFLLEPLLTWALAARREMLGPLVALTLRLLVVLGVVWWVSSGDVGQDGLQVMGQGYLAATLVALAVQFGWLPGTTRRSFHVGRLAAGIALGGLAGLALRVLAPEPTELPVLTAGLLVVLATIPTAVVLFWDVLVGLVAARAAVVIRTPARALSAEGQDA